MVCAGEVGTSGTSAARMTAGPGRLELSTSAVLAMGGGAAALGGSLLGEMICGKSEAIRAGRGDRIGPLTYKKIVVAN